MIIIIHLWRLADRRPDLMNSLYMPSRFTGDFKPRFLHTDRQTDTQTIGVYFRAQYV